MIDQNFKIEWKEENPQKPILYTLTYYAPENGLYWKQFANLEAQNDEELMEELWVFLFGKFDEEGKYLRGGVDRYSSNLCGEIDDLKVHGPKGTWEPLEMMRQIFHIKHGD